MDIERIVRDSVEDDLSRLEDQDLADAMQDIVHNGASAKVIEEAVRAAAGCSLIYCAQHDEIVSRYAEHPDAGSAESYLSGKLYGAADWREARQECAAAIFMSVSYQAAGRLADEVRHKMAHFEEVVLTVDEDADLSSISFGDSWCHGFAAHAAETHQHAMYYPLVEEHEAVEMPIFSSLWARWSRLARPRCSAHTRNELQRIMVDIERLA